MTGTVGVTVDEIVTLQRGLAAAWTRPLVPRAGDE